MLANDMKEVREMKKYIITWLQSSERIPGKPSEVRTFEDTYTALTLPLAIGQWQARCYTNAEIVGVQLVEGKGAAYGKAVVAWC